MRRIEAEGLVRRIPGKTRSYELTAAGVRSMPGLETVAYGPQDGMPIYRRWVEAGIANAGASPACPYCVGKESEMGKYCV